MRTAFLIFAAIVVLAAVPLAYYALNSGDSAAPVYRTAAVQRGDLQATIAATGTVEPEDVVDVGAQVAGKIEKLGADPNDPAKTIDYRSEVQEGTILAQIDDSVYRAQVAQQQAAVLRAKADLLQMQARLEQAKLDLERAESLRPQKAIAGSDYDVIVANYKAALANVAVGEATIKQAEAALSLATTNLNYTVIKSPVKGVIIARRVNVGQTVVSSLNAPSLFLIAKDLRKMQVWASVNEADIGRIHEGMPVHFTVDTHPGAVFRGEVAQVRLNATMTQNVVTYTVVVSTDNSDGRLLPYLTASLKFETDERHDVLLVPNGALRWKPKPQRIVPELREALAADDKSGGARREGSGKKGTEKTTAPEAALPAGETGAAPAEREGGKGPHGERGRVWVADGEFVRPLEVQVGVSDGVMSEVSGPQLKEGLEVVVGEAPIVSRNDGETKNPFAPTPLRGRSGGCGPNQKSQP